MTDVTHRRDAIDPDPQQPAGSEASHTAQGTAWGTNTAAVYASMRHGPDGALFLDPFFLPAVRSMSGMKVIDVGCGAGPWAVEAAKHGAEVHALDINPAMVTLAVAAAESNGVRDQVHVSQGDAAELRFFDSSFDRALSINVGCNLPSGSFSKHFEELFRVLKPGGIAIVTAPAHLDVVFTDGERDQDSLQREIQSMLGAIGFTRDPEFIRQQIGQLQGIYRATFYETSAGLDLLRPGGKLEPGAPIWRRIPGQGVANRYHDAEEYESAATAAGFILLGADRAVFANERERLDHNRQATSSSLGSEFLTHNAFLVLTLRKR